MVLVQAVNLFGFYRINPKQHSGLKLVTFQYILMS